MERMIKPLALALLMMFSVNFANAQFLKKLEDKTLLTIGDEKIPVNEFLRVYEKNNTPEEREKPDAIENYLDLYINFKLKVKEAEELKLDTVESFRRELAGYRKTLAKPYFNDESVLDSLIKEAYERMQYDLRASHILLMVDKNASPEDTLAAYKKISDIREMIINGEKDFKEAAIEYSEDPSARDKEEIPGKQRFRRGNHGDLGFFTVFNMVYPFETAAYNTPVGEISEPVRTDYGYHIIKVTDKRPAMGKAKVAHIFVRLREDATPEDSLRKTEKIFNIYEKLQEGMDWDSAAKEYSEDKGSAAKGGTLPEFACNRIVPEFVIVIDSLKEGEYSKPVRTMYGWHIVKLISKKQPGTFEEEKKELGQRVRRDMRSKLSKQAVIDKVKKDHNFKIFDDAKNEIFALIDTTVLEGTFKADSLNLIEDKPLMKLDQTVKTEMDFARYVEKHQRKQSDMKLGIYLNKLFKDFEDDFCMDYKDAHLEEEYPDFAFLMKEYHDGILLFNLSDQKVWTKAVEDTAGLGKYYNEHKDKYQWKQRTDATVYFIIKKDDVDKVYEILKSTDQDGEIAKKLQEDSIHSVKIKPGLFEEGDNKYVDKVSKEPGLYKAADSDVEDLTVFVRVKGIKPPMQKTLDEARGLVTADYQDYLEKEWVKALREKYPVKINEKVLKKLIEKYQ
jgi:peptidyl-prolyl cis-trans isomerase SurA